MPRFRANTTIGYAHGKEMIPSGAVFDPAALEIASELVSQMQKEKLVTSVGNDEPVTFGPAPEIKEPAQPKRPNATDSIKAVEAAETLEALETLAVGEDRATVLAAIEKKRLTLQPQE